MQFKISKLNNDYNLNIDVIEIENSNNYKVKFYTLGGYIHEVYIPKNKNPSEHEDVILGYNNLQDILKADEYFNFIIGRVCNRISNSSFTLNQKKYDLFSNDNDHHIHGGKNGFNSKIWKIKEISKDKNSVKCTLSYFSKNLEENYPGNLECTATYELNNKNEFSIYYEATTDEDTIINLTNHNYWNFHGHSEHFQNIEDHYIKIISNFYCENNEESIPNGKILNVKNSKFDLTNYFMIEKKFLNEGGIDNNYSLISDNKTNPVAIIYSNKTGMGVEYSTDQLGLQLYTGNMMKKKYKGKHKRTYGTQYGICLETQNFPDAINNSNFPSPILKKGDKYKSFTKMTLRNDFIY